jgi:hypothetical protein
MEEVSQIITIKEVTRDEWTEIWSKLRLYAWKRFGWLHDRIGLDLDEIVHKAIHDTLIGVRRWPPVKTKTGEIKKVDLFYFLCQVVRSNVSHEWEREKKRVPIDSVGNGYDQDEYHLKSLETLIYEAAEAYPYLVHPIPIDRQLIDKEFEQKVFDLLENDEILTKVLKLLYAGVKPLTIAQELGMTIEEVRAAQKRLRRKVQILLEEMNYGKE